MLEGAAQLSDFSRLAQEAALQAIMADTPVIIDWQAQGEMRRDAGLGDGVVRPALHLRARTRLPLVCQRCLQPAWMTIAVDRHFLFAPDEAQAMQLDERAQDDVLAAREDFDLLGLIEDELLLALPLVPHHERCPQALPAHSAGFAAEQEEPDQPHPFAALAALKRQNSPDNL
ncbi:MAG: DUF177 domain-containing protein [Burkholderiaceae bacterium]|nr:DUF177 domain-containing protein [Burkholderiaceae bacterium]